MEKLPLLYSESPKINYDAKFDVLYCTVADNSNSRAVEDFGDIEVFRDFDTDEITGYTVFNFKTICKEKSSEYAMLSRLFDVQALAKELTGDD